MIYVIGYIAIGSVLAFGTWEMLKESAEEHEITEPLDLAMIAITAIALWPLFSVSAIFRNWDKR